MHAMVIIGNWKCIFFSVRSHYGCFEGENDVGFMFLVEVALGKESSIKECDCSLTKAPKGYDSIVARGRCEPGEIITDTICAFDMSWLNIIQMRKGFFLWISIYRLD